MNKRHLILGIGELLWDFLPSGPMLGGAPANFAFMAGHLGNHAVILSRIGCDEPGRRVIDILEPMPVDASAVQVDTVQETGRVTVNFAGPEPIYTIHKPSAWDFMEPSEEWLHLAERADALCFGSLAQRSSQSRRTIQTLVAHTSESCIRVFDVNLRAPFYSGEVIEESLELATVVKMNEDEAPLVLRLLGLEPELEPEPKKDATLKRAHRLLGIFSSLQLVAITRGARGSLLATRDEWHDHPGLHVQAVDSMGAGDAFTAAITHTILSHSEPRLANLARLNEAGNRWGSWVATQAGAMPAPPDAVRDAIEEAIEASSGANI